MMRIENCDITLLSFSDPSNLPAYPIFVKAIPFLHLVPDQCRFHTVPAERSQKPTAMLHYFREYWFLLDVT